MSFYTNDTDTLRQMISQSIPQTLSSIFTVVSVFCSMLTLSIWLTLFLIAFLCCHVQNRRQGHRKKRQLFCCASSNPSAM